MAERKIEFTDRYQALGIPYPNRETMCHGQCEGIGLVPHKKEDKPDGLYDPLWDEAHEKAGEHDCDGWHFVTCPTCNGSGKAIPAPKVPTKEEGGVE